MIDNLYYLSRKIPERCENSFVDYKIGFENFVIYNDKIN